MNNISEEIYIQGFEDSEASITYSYIQEGFNGEENINEDPFKQLTGYPCLKSAKLTAFRGLRKTIRADTPLTTYNYL
ncbi:MAG: hypothetical protein ACMUJM_19255 [bacterium]